MRALPRLAPLACCLALLAGCGGGDAPPRQGADGDRAILAITTPPDASTTVLARRDPDTLAPVSAPLELGEYHGAWAFSPDGRRLALGTFARTGLRIVDPVALRVERDVPLPIAGVGVAWIGPERVAVLLQGGGVAVVDVAKGRVERVWPLAYDLPCGKPPPAASRHGAVFAVAGRGGAVRLVRVTGDGPPRVLELPRLRARSSARACGPPALAIAPAGDRALVLAGRGPAAVVDLASMRARLRRLPGPRTSARCRAAGAACASRRTAAFVSDRAVVIAGSDAIGRAARVVPAGAWRLDVRRWRLRRIDRTAAAASVSGGDVLTFGGPRSGVSLLSPAGTRRWRALRGTHVRDAIAAGPRVYALDDALRATRVLDAATGRVVSRVDPLMRLDVVVRPGRTGR